MVHIGIVGAGVGGLHLALKLLQHGLSPTLYTEKTAAEMRKEPLTSTVALFGTARDHGRKLGVAHWDVPDTGVHELAFGIERAPGMEFVAPVIPPLQFIDMRLYLPRLLEDFESRGGRVVHTVTLDQAGVAKIAGEHDLVVVASGRGALADMFPRVAERSPFTEPQRRLMGGLFRGVELCSPGRFTRRASEHGDVCEFPFLTANGAVCGFLIFAVPGAAFEPITRARHADDPAGFHKALIELLREHAPVILERVDSAKFEAISSRDILQGAVLPIARRGVKEVSPGKFALAIGDAHVTNDPIIAQGANSASRAAWMLGEALVARAAEGKGFVRDGAAGRASAPSAPNPFDAEWCEDMEQRLWALAEPGTIWSNASLLPPPAHIGDLVAAAARLPGVAAEFSANFDNPAAQLEVLKDAESVQALIRRHSPPSPTATQS